MDAMASTYTTKTGADTTGDMNDTKVNDRRWSSVALLSIFGWIGLDLKSDTLASLLFCPSPRAIVGFLRR